MKEARLNLRFEEATVDLARRTAAQEGVTITQFVTEAILEKVLAVHEVRKARKALAELVGRGDL